MTDQHTLSSRSRRALERIGDIYIPGDEALPSFSALGCVEEVGRLLWYLPASDARNLGTLLGVLSCLPDKALRAFVVWVERSPMARGPHASTLRTIRIGLRGLVMSLYYGDPTVLAEIGGELYVHVGSATSLPDH